MGSWLSVDLDPEEIMSLGIGQIDIQFLGAKGVNILTNCYEAAGQSVKHFHVHVIPRYESHDGFELEMKSNAEGLNLPVLAETIKNNLK